MFVVVAMGISCAQAEDLQVADGVITTAIVNQMPADKIESYRADFGKLYCFTRIVGAQEDTVITHVWYYQDNELARVPLPIRSSNWRTYSSKRVLPQWAGEWKVVILDEKENEIATIPFILE
ncbi:MAG: DUF2914 domain-containing protein [Deltaproteobacteria bacterium]|nr:MAG: DUF2914 domain-containing protein [Deltaproteobacteria bacterium]RLB78786.1 MAG: DUF2914 domain-containing protein [Deltaproteobacteria bacterium]